MSKSLIYLPIEFERKKANTQNNTNMTRFFNHTHTVNQMIIPNHNLQFNNNNNNNNKTI